MDQRWVLNSKVVGLSFAMGKLTSGKSLPTRTFKVRVFALGQKLGLLKSEFYFDEINEYNINFMSIFFYLFFKTLKNIDDRVVLNS